MFKDFKALLRHPVLFASLIVILFLPIIYSAVFIYSMWDPYGQTKDLPIAIVNNDQGAKIQDKEENLGDRVIKKLKKNDDFKWEFVDSKKAHKGIEKGTYFAVIEFPENFSDDAATMLNPEPRQMKMNVKTNPGYSYSGQSIGDKSIQAVKENISLSLRELYLKKIFSNIKDMRGHSEKLNTNLKKMKQAEEDLADGSQQVDNGLAKTQSMLPPLQNDQFSQLITGSQQITGGLNELAANTNKMTQAIDQSLKQTDNLSFDQDNAVTISNPVETVEHNVTEVKNYGQSFAPYVLSLSLYVGAIAFVTIYPVDKRVGESRSAINWWLNKLLLILTHGLLQGLFLSLFTLYVIEIEIANKGDFTLTLVTWSIAAVLLVSFLVAAFGNIGKFFAIILLILQLGSSEGTFPIQLTNKFFQNLHPLSPMTYVIKALRESIFDFESSVPLNEAQLIISMIGISSALLLYLAYLGRLNIKNLRLNTRDLD
ncbi:YhgE/Pip family protein [Macrococcoides caseolyticum]|uniref:YhgE/Pip family protein n=1 Tax=Macrococcoides caseolyticum TaxID=69966 RepID=UPI001F1AA732|nr:YhgE/Pip family protein [Macrococcus caseolyticus]MCE4956618.1 YhgE/Pip family protein [Macrococcus caseolyticus]